MRRVLAVLAVAAALVLACGQAALAEIRPPIGGENPPKPPSVSDGLSAPPLVGWGMELVDVHVNGKWLYDALWPDALPYIDPETDRTMVPVRCLTEYLGAKVDWYGDEQKVVVSLPDRTIELWIGKKVAKVNGEERELDAPPVLRSWQTHHTPPRTMWRTWVPLRFVTECLGGAVDWTPAGQPSKSVERQGITLDRVEVLITYPAPK